MVKAAHETEVVAIFRANKKEAMTLIEKGSERYNRKSWTLSD
jgi:hypothetical protein